MLYQITDGTVSLGGIPVLWHFDFEIRGTEKIAVVGRNGAGKTTLLRLISGDLSLDADDKRKGPGVLMARAVTTGMLSQQVFDDPERTVEEELMRSCPAKDPFSRERYAYEQEYDRLFTGFGFRKEEKGRKIKHFSGGEQTRIALIRLLLERPDILLLDEPTNHLDISAAEWLEEYLRTYPHAVVMVSHDRFFLDRAAEVVYEVSAGKLIRYPGNYTHYREEKVRRTARETRAWERQQEELSRLSGVVERFKHKPAKAAFARAKKKQMDRMEHVQKPEPDDVHIFTGDITPEVPGAKWVLDAEHLKLGYGKTAVLELSLRIRRGQKVGLLGPNGAGKSTFLKTVAGLIPQLSGKCTLGNQVTLGYFDQHSAELTSEKTVLEHFHDLFPALTQKEARSILGAYLFGGKLAAQPVGSLSGGEKARLVLAELLQSRPNFLILDEPTNHMDIQAKETLESAFRAYRGTILFVSHDRYFIRQVAESILIFENHAALYYPFGYEHYLEKVRRAGAGQPVSAQVSAEDQALIAGLRAVPRAERHQTRELSTEEAYLDWKLSLAAEQLAVSGEWYARFLEKCREREESRRQDEAGWLAAFPWMRGDAAPGGMQLAGAGTPAGKGQQTGAESLAAVADEKSPQSGCGESGFEQEEELEKAWEAWHAACLDYLDIFL